MKNLVELRSFASLRMTLPDPALEKALSEGKPVRWETVYASTATISLLLSYQFKIIVF